jgi:hypothetical protein
MLFFLPLPDRFVVARQDSDFLQILNIIEIAFAIPGKKE